jgi:hypothetical protein
MVGPGARPGKPSRRARWFGIAGWAVIVGAGAALEVVSLAGESVPTASEYVSALTRPVPGRIAMLLAWVVLGYWLFGLRRDSR